MKKKHDIVLAIPPRSGKNFKFLTWQPPVNLAYLAAYLRKFDFNPIIQDYAIYNFEEYSFREYIKNLKPYIFGVYCMSFNIMKGDYICKIVKEESPETLTIVGGPHSTAIPIETINEFKGFDVIAIGEGEETLKEIAFAIRNKTSLSGINGIVYKVQDKIIQEKPRKVIEDIDSLPFPARDLFDWEYCKKMPQQCGIVPFNHFATSIYSSRGCPSKCTFCAAPISGQNTIRFRSTNNILSEIEHLKLKYGIDHIIFQDDTFTIKKDRVSILCKGMKEIGIKSWSCDAKVTTVNPELLDEMKQSGCIKISYGIESGSERILKLIKKGITIEQVRNAINWSRKAKIQIIEGNFIIGVHPTETIEEIELTRKLLLELPLDLAAVSVVTPFPGTELAQSFKEFGCYKKINWSDFMLISEKINWNTLYMTGKELQKMQKKMINEFYFSPKYILRMIKRIENFREIFYYMQNGIEYFKYLIFNK